MVKIINFVMYILPQLKKKKYQKKVYIKLDPDYVEQLIYINYPNIHRKYTGKNILQYE